MSDESNRARGTQWWEKVMGFSPPPIQNDPFVDATIDHLFADLWSRPGLSVRDRRLVTLGLLMAFGHEPTLRLHVGAALRSGDLDDAALDEVVLHVAHYAGWPKGAVASQLVRQIRAEQAIPRGGPQPSPQPAK